MKNFLMIFSLILALPGSCCFAQNRSIQFNEKPWDEIIAMAQKEQKLIFMDAYATWCGPCKWMSANMFTRDSIADFYNNQFICTKFDMEQGEGIELAKKYQVSAYPTLLFINANGDMVHKKVGALRYVREYIDLGKTALDPQENLSAYQKRFAGGEHSAAFIMKYIPKLKDAYLPYKDEINKYFESQGDAALTSRENWEIIKLYVDDIDSKAFRYLVSHTDEYIKLYTRDSVYRRMEDILDTYLNSIIRATPFSEANYQKAKAKVTEMNIPVAGKVFFISDLNICQYKGDKKGYIDLAMKKTDEYCMNDYALLNNIAFSFAHIAEDPAQLEKAEKWAKRSVEINPQPANCDTYATLLLRLGKKEEAIKYTKKALELARANHLPTKEYEDELKELEGAGK